MTSGNHTYPPTTILATAELGTRVMMFGDEIGISDDQLKRVISLSKRWKLRYIDLAEEVFEYGRQIDDELNTWKPDRSTIMNQITQRNELTDTLDREFCDTIIGLNEILSQEQFRRLLDVYYREFANTPHPVLGSGAKEQLVGAR